MRQKSLVAVGLFVAASLPLVAVACSSASGSADPVGSDGGGPDGSTTPVREGGSEDSAASDAGSDAPIGTTADEIEPNDGKTATEIGKMTVPGTMNGAIDPANDIDVFSVTLTPGELWDWTVTPTGADLAPHFALFDTTPNNLNPPAVVAGTPGKPLTASAFVLRPGAFVAAVRDARNVPTASGRGGATYGYALTATKKTPAPVAVTFPSTKSGKLASLGAVDLYTFTGTSGKGFDIVVRAKRKAAPSTLDSRLSLFDITAKKALITNDDAAGTSDSQVGSDDPAPSTYMVIVENEGTDATDLSYEIEFSLR